MGTAPTRPVRHAGRAALARAPRRLRTPHAKPRRPQEPRPRSCAPPRRRRRHRIAPPGRRRPRRRPPRGVAPGVLPHVPDGVDRLAERPEHVRVVPGRDERPDEACGLPQPRHEPHRERPHPPRELPRARALVRRGAGDRPAPSTRRRGTARRRAPARSRRAPPRGTSRRGGSAPRARASRSRAPARARRAPASPRAPRSPSRPSASAQRRPGRRPTSAQPADRARAVASPSASSSPPSPPLLHDAASHGGLTLTVMDGAAYRAPLRTRSRIGGPRPRRTWLAERERPWWHGLGFAGVEPRWTGAPRSRSEVR